MAHHHTNRSKIQTLHNLQLTRTTDIKHYHQESYLSMRPVADHAWVSNSDDRCMLRLNGWTCVLMMDPTNKHKEVQFGQYSRLLGSYKKEKAYCYAPVF